MATRDELLESLVKRYRAADREKKSRILDEFVKLTGYHRKHATRVLNTWAPKPKTARQGRRLYGDAVRDTLVIFWEASGRLCGKRLRAAIPQLLASMEHHGHVDLDDDLRERLLRMSAATIDRALEPARAEQNKLRRRRRKSTNSVKSKIPVRTFADWDDPSPGFFEIDFVVHGGGSAAGRFIHSLVLTDIASGWTEAVPLLARDQHLVVEALDQVRAHLPMPMLGIDTDNDSTFINDTMIEYCERTGLEFTRGRPRKKNDQAWIEQKNGAVIRGLVGYARFEGLAHAKVLARLYAAARLHVNIFQPSFKLKSKERVGAKVKKIYYPPATPAQRLGEHPQIKAEVSARLEQLVTELDPVRLLKIIRAAQSELAGEAETQDDRGDEEELEAFLGSLSKLWKLGEVRPTHKKEPRPPRTWRTRKDPFEDVWSEIEVWLKVEPDLTAKLAFDRLEGLHPNEFKPGQLRTLQRRFRTWREQAARELVAAPAEQLVPTSSRSTASLSPGENAATLGGRAGARHRGGRGMSVTGRTSAEDKLESELDRRRP